nr:hypothetical protein [Tanacetum cinerariifolium]
MVLSKSQQIYMDKSEFCLLKLLKRFWQERERERERKKSKDYLAHGYPEDHLAKFHKMTDAKEMWEAIKSRFCGNDESKKMQKYLLKQQFKSFSISNSEGLHKVYDRFQSLLSQLETHGAGPGVDTLNFNVLYNNLRVFESNVKGSTGSSTSSQNVAFVSFENTISTNEVNTTYGGSTSSCHNSQKEGSSSYTDDLMYSFFANQSSGPQLDYEDLKQVDEFDLEEIDLKWQVAMISARLKKSKGNLDSRRRDAGNTGYKARDNGKRPLKQDEHKAMVTVDGEGVDWTGHVKDETEDYALISDTEMSAKDKSGLGYGSQIHDGVLSYENEVFASVFDSSESNAKTSDLDSCDSNSSIETLESVPKPVANEPKDISEPKVWSDAPIIEEYESDSDDEHVTIPLKEQENPSFAFVNIVKHIKTPRQTVKEPPLHPNSLKLNNVETIDNRIYYLRLRLLPHRVISKCSKVRNLV